MGDSSAPLGNVTLRLRHPVGGVGLSRGEPVQRPRTREEMGEGPETSRMPPSRHSPPSPLGLFRGQRFVSKAPASHSCHFSYSHSHRARLGKFFSSAQETVVISHIFLCNIPDAGKYKKLWEI